MWQLTSKPQNVYLLNCQGATD